MIRLLHVLAALASLLRRFSAAFLVPLPVALAYDERDADVFGFALPRAALVFVACAAATYVAGFLLERLARRTAEGMGDREGYLAVAFGALVLPMAAMLPYRGMGTLHGWLPGYFQATSDLTTTAFSILPAGTEPSLIFWRAFLQWVGALLIVIVGVAVLANLSGSPGTLVQSDPNPALSRLKPRLAATARSITGLYLGVTGAFIVLLTLLLLRRGLEVPEAVFQGLIHALGGFSTGGATTALGIAGLADPWFEAALVVLMLLGASHFHVVLALAKGKIHQAWREPEWRFMLGVWVMMCLLLVATLTWNGMPIREALRGGLFTATSIQTGTGFWNVSDATWPVAATFPLLVLMFLGGSSGSPTGGLKAFRLMLGAKVLGRQLRLLVHPRAVLPLRLGERTIHDTAVATATAFLFTYVLAWALGTVAIANLEPGMGPMEAAGASAAAIGNVGLGFGQLGPGGSPALLSDATQWVLVALMWLGRLEIFAALLIFYPSSWRH